MYDQEQQRAMPANSTASVVTGVSLGDLFLRENSSAETTGRTTAASTAATAAHDEVIVGHLQAGETLLEVGTPANRVIHELDAETQKRQLPTAATATGCSSTAPAGALTNS